MELMDLGSQKHGPQNDVNRFSHLTFDSPCVQINPYDYRHVSKIIPGNQDLVYSMKY